MADILINPARGDVHEAATSIAQALDGEGFARAKTAITAWPGYGVTPLAALPGLAKEVSIASLHYKDESQRFGLGSFKALGGAYAVGCLLARELERRGIASLEGPQALLNGDYADAVKDITVCSATDGNHGRSVAWGAQTFGCRAVIFLHETVSEGREIAIAGFGAEVIRTSGNFDDSVRIAKETAEREGWFVVSDTSYPGYREIPTDVMQGYGVMTWEALDQFQSQTGGALPSHVFLQTGVGGMAASVVARLYQLFGDHTPKIILADPRKSACWYESIKAGRPMPVEGDLDTIMAGLACGEVSLIAWDCLGTSADAVILVDDDEAEDCMRRLASGVAGDAPLVAGESAVAGLAALLSVASDKEARESLGLGPDSRVLLFGTEGATDPEVYERIVGRPPEDVA